MHICTIIAFRVVCAGSPLHSDRSSERASERGCPHCGFHAIEMRAWMTASIATLGPQSAKSADSSSGKIKEREKEKRQ